MPSHTTHPITSDSTIKQSQPITADTSGTNSRVTTDGSIVHSADSTTHPDASLGQKLKGNVAGTVKGTVGSMQAATGATIRNQSMESKGLEKMQDEDERLGAKRGVMPVGSNQRMAEEDA